MDDAVSAPIFDAQYFRGKAAGFRKLATEHKVAGNGATAAKLNAVAAELKAEANQLERGQPERLPNRPPPAQCPP